MRAVCFQQPTKSNDNGSRVLLQMMRAGKGAPAFFESSGRWWLSYTKRNTFFFFTCALQIMREVRGRFEGVLKELRGQPEETQRSEDEQRKKTGCLVAV